MYNNNIKEKLMNSILSEFNYTGFTKNQDEPYVSTVGPSKYFCVGIIDIVNSTNTVAKLPQNKAPRYYELFLNLMAKTVMQFNAKILKTMGDGLLFYFPDTCYSDRKFCFLSAIEYGFSLMNSHSNLNQQLEDEGIPQIDFRISFDYGIVTMMKNVEWKVDLVGPTINTCAKINSCSPINGMVFGGGDLYERTKNFHEYEFKKHDSYSMDLKHLYPLYTVSRKN